MREVVIVSAARTALGSFGGSLASVPAVELGAVAIRAALSRGGVDAGMVEEVVMGNVLQAGLGQNPARQAAVKAGVPLSAPAYTVGMVCGSGMKSVIEAGRAIGLTFPQIFFNILLPQAVSDFCAGRLSVNGAIVTRQE